MSEFNSVAESWCPGFGDDRQLVTQNWEIEMVSRDNHDAAVAGAAATTPMAGMAHSGSLHKLMILRKSLLFVQL